MNRRTTRGLVKLFHAIMVAFMLVGSTGLPQSFTQPARAQAREVGNAAPQAADWPELARARLSKSGLATWDNSDPQSNGPAQKAVFNPSLSCRRSKPWRPLILLALPLRPP